MARASTLTQVIVTHGRAPRMLHRSDCPHPVAGVTVFRDATPDELRTLPACTHCAGREKKEREA